MPFSKLPIDGHVTVPQARLRVLQYLAKEATSVYTPMSWCGKAIWPNSRMSSQGLAIAASKIVRGLQNDGLVRWRCDKLGRSKATAWGYQITDDGRRWLADNEGVA